jgi:hypothetical protein
MQLLLLRSRVAIRGFPSTAACLATASGAAVMWRSGTATLAPSSRVPPLRTACTTAGRRPRPNASPNRRQPASLQVEAPAGSRLERPSPACNRQARSSSSTSSQTVRKAPRVAPFCPKNESFYRDRLGTNIGKLKTEAFVAGNLCVYKGSDPSHNRGQVWCSGGNQGGQATTYSTVLQTDGNLCTYASAATAAAAAAPVWCSHTPVCAETPCDLWAGLGDDGRFCVHRGSACGAHGVEHVWCSPK